MTNPGRSGRKVRILLIEDNAADADLLRRALRHAHLDCEFTVLEDGAEALSYVRGLEGEQEGRAPDLAVLDLNLPKNDGVEVLQAMRSNRAFSQVPVAIITSSSSARERARVEQYGVGRYITKPPDLDEYLQIGDTLKELLGERGVFR